MTDDYLTKLEKETDKKIEDLVHNRLLQESIGLFVEIYGRPPTESDAISINEYVADRCAELIGIIEDGFRDTIHDLGFDIEDMKAVEEFELELEEEEKETTFGFDPDIDQSPADDKETDYNETEEKDFAWDEIE